LEILSQTASFVPGPNNAVCFAGMAFVLSFSAANAEELRGTGVGVTCLCPRGRGHSNYRQSGFE